MNPLALAAFLLLAAAALTGIWLWQSLTRDQNGRHQRVGPPVPVYFRYGANPYPPAGEITLSPFPGDGPPPVPQQRESDQRLYDTSELRQLAYAGDLEAIRAHNERLMA